MHINITTTNNRIIAIIPIYRPPSSNINTFIEELDQCINNINKKRDVIIVGDINIDIKKQNAITTKYLNTLSSNGLQCMVTETTREDVNINSSTCIDHLFVRSNQRRSNTHADVITTTISDHYALFGCVENEDKTDNKTHKQKGADFNAKVNNTQGTDLNTKINNSKVNSLINATNWNEIITKSYNTNELFVNICNVFDNIYEKCKEKTKGIKKRNPYPWLSEELLKYCDIRDKLNKKWQQNKKNLINEQVYKKFSNKLNKKIINAKNIYNYNQFIQNRNNIRGTWQAINEIIGKKTNNIDDTIKRNFKNENLINVTEKVAQNFQENVQNIIHTCDIKTVSTAKSKTSNTLFLSYTNEEEIYNILKNLNAKKSPGADGIRAIDLKNHASILLPVITSLINSSLRESTIPELLKISLIRPIYKNGSKSDYINYRPISILSVVEKVLEEIIVRRLNDFLVKYKIINKQQFGFQKNKNINQLLGLFSNDVNKSLSENKHCLALFIDFSKAFDTLSHNKLIEILERNGIRGHCLEWFKNFLHCRTFRVKIENNLSRTTETTHGVPQGSKIGPVLYIIYANEMMNILKESKAYAYADDTAIIVSNECIDTATRIMQKELDVVTRWCHDSGLVINAAKTKLMHIRPRHFPQTNIKLIFHNTECLHKIKDNNNTPMDTCSTYIELVSTYKYLGVHLDNHFKWKTHIDDLQKKLRKSSYALYHLSNCAPYYVLRQAYFSLVESYLRHGIAAWGNAKYCKHLQTT